MMGLVEAPPGAVEAAAAAAAADAE
jgi:hypothetical protein